MYVAGFTSLLTVGRWLDEALSEGQRQVRHPDDGPSANRPWVIAKFVIAAICLAAVLPYIFIGGLMYIGYGGYRSFAFGFLAFAFLVAVVLAIVLAVRRARR